jgi:thymidine kinase
MAKLHFRYSAMNAGKSTVILQVAHNYREQGMNVALFAAAVDDRYGVGRITSRLGIGADALTYDAETNFDVLLPKDVACCLIDEAQFLSPGQVKQIHRWVHANRIPVMCFGLRSDFQGNPFPGSAMLLSLADELEEVRTICRCGKKATMNIRLSEDGLRVCEGDQVVIGGNASYRQSCAGCFYWD